MGCETNMIAQPHQKHVNLTQIKEEDESKTSRHNSPQTRRCQSQILLKTKFNVKNEISRDAPDSPNPSSSRHTEENNQSNKMSDKINNQEIQEEHSDTEDEEECSSWI